MFNRPSRGALLAAFAVTAGLAASTAQATPSAALAESAVEVRVSYADLDIKAPAGAHRLMQRIAKAAATVCGGGPDSRLYDDKLAFDHCRRDAYGRAVTQLDAAIVTAAGEPMTSAIAVTAH